MLVVNESGLYALIFKSRKPEAKRFKKWVTSEVLPAIRKSGGYIHESAMVETLTNAHLRQLFDSVDAATRTWIFGDHSKNWIYNHIRIAFQVPRVQDIPDQLFPAVMQLVAEKKEACDDFFEFMNGARDWFDRDVLGLGHPWTPTIKSKLTKALKRQVILPPRVDWLALANQVAPVADRRASV